jgi:hypothetical protein
MIIGFEAHSFLQKPFSQDLQAIIYLDCFLSVDFLLYFFVDF